MKITPKSKQELTNLLDAINKYLAKPVNERSQEAELKFRAEISKIAPKIIQLWVNHHGFQHDKFWEHYLNSYTDSKH